MRSEQRVGDAARRAPRIRPELKRDRLVRDVGQDDIEIELPAGRGNDDRWVQRRRLDQNGRVERIPETGVECAGAAVAAGAGGRATAVGMDTNRSVCRLVDDRTTRIPAFGVSLVAHRGAGGTGVWPDARLLGLVPGKGCVVGAITRDAEVCRPQILNDRKSSALRLDGLQAGLGIVKYLEDTPVVADAAIDRLLRRRIDRVLILRTRHVQRTVRVRLRDIKLKHVQTATGTVACRSIQSVVDNPAGTSNIQKTPGARVG